MLEWIPYVLLGIIVLFPLLHAGLWLNTRRLRGRPAPEFRDLVGDAALADAERVLFYFYSHHCGPCRTMTPRLSRLAEEYPNVVMVDVGEQDELCCRFGVSAVPALVLVKHGTIHRALLGRHSERAVRALLAG